MNELLKNSRNVFYFSNINKIGGVESFFWYLAQTYKNIEVYYKTGDIGQISRLAKIIPVYKYTGQKIICNRFFCQYNIDILDNVEANEICYIIHCDYGSVKISPILDKRIDKYIGVSKVACDSFTELTGINAELIYNPIVINPKEKILTLVSATRLTYEKGKDTMIALANKLDEAGIKYLWLIFTDDKDRKHEINNPNMVYIEPRIDIAPYLKIADYVVQCSSTESFGYTPNEALLMGIPVILTDLPIWHELGIKDGIHGYIIKDINKFDVKKLLNIPKNFTYKLPKSNWGKYLDNKTNYDPNQKIKVKVIKDYDDLELKVHKIYGEEFEVGISRAIYLVALGLVKEI